MLSPGDISAILLDAAGRRCEEEGLGYAEIMEKLDTCWMTGALEQRQLLAVPAGRDLTVTAGERTQDPVKFMRTVTLWLDGQEAATCTFTFIAVHRTRRTIRRLSRLEPYLAPPGAVSEHISVPRLNFGRELPQAGHFSVTAADCDPNGHMNTANYIRAVCHTLGTPGAPNCITVCFERECLPGETLCFYAENGQIEGRRGDGSVSFRALITAERERQYD